MNTALSGAMKTVSQSSSDIGLAGLAVSGGQAGVHVLLAAMPWPVAVLMFPLYEMAGVIAMASVSFENDK